MSNSFPEENEEEEGEQEFQPQTHHPSAPPHELFDISTTVDPSYVISLIRKLIPSDVKDDETALQSGLLCEEPNTEGVADNSISMPENGGEDEAMEYSENYGKVDGPGATNDNQNRGGSKREETWEECGCILWDLAASEDHAQLMVQNFIYDVLLANLVVSQSSRITEISLGIIGNLACHEISRKQIASTNGLVRVIVDQLFQDDVPCLCEACRVVTLCLQGSEGVIWAEALQTEQILSRTLWIAENALNPLLIEKSVGLLLAVLESQQEVADIVLPPLVKLGLSGLLINLLAFEMSKFRGERITERYSLLDLILRTIEALSIIDDYSQEICQNKELLEILKELIKLPDKIEISSSCITAAVLIANILSDAKDLASELSQDFNFLQGMFDVFPFASHDTEAQNAIWSTIARLLKLVQENDMSPPMLHHLVSILSGKLDLIEDELLVHQLDHRTSSSSSAKTDDRFIVTKRISDILTIWKFLDDEKKSTVSMEDYYINEEDVDKLLSQCCKASSC
ncbi:hypothetical protein ACJIZ3_012233 [Penstemon smallii]|uniref:ARM repeat superfamily protein n=1 Tax=Penstemon smallii TaxID=265156 RepID=A0ABD3UNK2_9LAMI